MGFASGLLNVLLVLSSLFLICLVLIQRGKGGGLAGAFGGVGGSSAFGTKAGDVFTRVTIITAGIWFLLAMVQVAINNNGPGARTSAFALDDESENPREIDLTGKKAADGKTKAAPASADKSAAPASKTTTDKTAAPAKTKTDTSLPDALEDAPAPTTTKPATPAKKTP